MSEEVKNIKGSRKESPLDFNKLFQDILKYKRLYYKVLPLTFLMVALYTICLPNYYTCTVMLSPEMSTSRTSRTGLAALASSFGVNLSNSAVGSEALFPTLYPELMNSVDFKTSLFNVKVTREEDKQTFTYYDYLLNEQKRPWWTTVKGAVLGTIKSLFVSGEKKEEKKEIDPFKLTKKQTAIAKVIDRKVVCDVDKKTMVITIKVTDQDPLICATMADSVKTRLQNFITDYRTSKARVDLDYNKKLYGEVKAKYEQARERYATFADSHRDISSQEARTRLSDFQTEMQLRQNIYQQVVAQLQQAEMKVQEETPAFTTLQSATVPTTKSGPARVKMCIIFVFLAFLGTTTWVFHKEGDLKPLLGLS